ncbi:helicase associated domain-containing protein [Kitasatospora cineracea]|uniref:helicase associated domain-containing protein n=1 Tax=Kitasatospora cineracea TaxID=88074 RepID=UPI000F4D7F45|nr:helicase associated domain-containing protein [Kitasatospora cineracea]
MTIGGARQLGGRGVPGAARTRQRRRVVVPVEGGAGHRKGGHGLGEQNLLAEIGIEEDPVLAEAAAVKKARKAAAAGRSKKPTVSQADRFAFGVAALAKFAAREGRNKPVPQSHVDVLERVVVGPDAVEGTETTPIKLGSWVGNQRTRRPSLSPDQIAALAEHGLVLG